MIVTIVGKCYKCFVDKKTGQPKSYSQGFGSYKFAKADSLNGNKCDGEQVIAFYFDDCDYDDFVLGRHVSLDFDPKGRLLDYEFVD